MKFIVRGFESAVNTVVVEADNESDAVDRAWEGEGIDDSREVEPGKNIWKRRWNAEEAEEVPGYDPFNKGLTMFVPK